MSLSSTSDVIEKFELFAGDETELSTVEELDLEQKIYNEVLESHEWEFLKTPFSGVQSTSVPYVALPADFRNMIKNRDLNKKVVYVQLSSGAFDPYEVIPFDLRRNYRNAKGYAYVDLKLNRLYFTLQPDAANPIEFDYLYIPPALALTLSDPIFPTRFYDVLYHGMCADNEIIQRSEKARSYQKENTARYAQILQDMRAWDARVGNWDDYGIA